MNPAVALLIFVVAAVATVVISVVVQQYTSRRSTYLADPSRLGNLRTGHGRAEKLLPGEAGRNTTIDGHHGDGSPPTPEDALREARAEELEAVADRERRHAERAEAEARRLREHGDETLGPAPKDQRARRAGVAPDDLDY